MEIHCHLGRAVTVRIRGAWRRGAVTQGANRISNLQPMCGTLSTFQSLDNHRTSGKGAEK